MSRDIYQSITDRFIEQLKKGTVSWQQPWTSCVQNIVSRKPYRGINAFTLGMTDRTSPFWLTFKQALDLGGHVRKGEKSLPVICYKILEKRDAAGNVMVREDVSVGSGNETIGHPREVFRAAIIGAAYALVLMHNHPSGDPMPSQADDRMTRRMADVANLLEIQFLDHVVIGTSEGGRQPYYSFREAGKL